MKIKKRELDFIASILGKIILCPIMLTIALLIKLTSKGSGLAKINGRDELTIEDKVRFDIEY